MSTQQTTELKIKGQYVINKTFLNSESCKATVVESQNENIGRKGKLS